jgi:hypothetical protein
MTGTKKEEVIPDREIVLIHALSELEHKQWCSWATALLTDEILSKERRKRWNKLISLPYDKLTGADQYQDRRWANEVLEILWRMGIETMTLSPTKVARSVSLSDIELAWLRALMPGFGNDPADVLRYIMRSWIGDRMGLDWMAQTSGIRKKK